MLPNYNAKLYGLLINNIKTNKRYYDNTPIKKLTAFFV